MNAPTNKNVVGIEIMDKPQVHNSKVEFLLLVIVIRFDSCQQLLQLFNQRFQYHIEMWTKMIQTK
jgi:L-ribulose-5-phosphate 3-epimerase UlaE